MKKTLVLIALFLSGLSARDVYEIASIFIPSTSCPGPVRYSILAGSMHLVDTVLSATAEIPIGQRIPISELTFQGSYRCGDSSATFDRIETVYPFKAEYALGEGVLVKMSKVPIALATRSVDVVKERAEQVRMTAEAWQKRQPLRMERYP